MPGTALVKSVAGYVEATGLFPRDARMVVGVSGGPDSMALLHVLAALNRELGYALDLHVAHLNHGLRGADAEEDAVFVDAAADALELPRTIEKRDIGALAAARGGSLEETARRERYAFLGRVSLTIRAGFIAVGHHADDNVETVLHRLLRGTGIRGLAGIPPRRRLHPAGDTQIVRPLLPFSRSDILAFLDANGVTYREDLTNASMDNTRSKIRHGLLPYLEAEFNPQVGEAILRLMEQARWTDQYLRETVEKTFEPLVIDRTDQDIALNAQALARKGRIVQTELLRLAIASFGVGEQSLGFEHLRSVTDLVSGAASGKQIALPGGLTARLAGNRLEISRPGGAPRDAVAAEVSVSVPGRTALDILDLELECDLIRVTEAEIARQMHNRDRLEEWFDADRVRLPLSARTRRPGDRFSPLGGPGSKTVADFLCDLKMDPEERDQVVLLCDQLGPIWVVGHRIDDRVKLTESSRDVFRVRVRGL